MKRLAGLIIPLTLILATGCGHEVDARSGGLSGGRQVSADYPSYESMDQLVAASDTTAIARIGEIATREIDDGGTGIAEAGVPMIFYHATLIESLEGPAREKQIIVGWPDLDKMPIEGRSSLDDGDMVVLFAQVLTPRDAPGIDTQREFYVPVGGDGGVMDVTGDTAVARSPIVRGTGTGVDTSSDPNGHLKISLTDLRAAVATLSNRPASPSGAMD